MTRATLSNVASSATNVNLLPANSRREMVTIWNDSTAILYVKFGVTAALTSATVAIASQGYYEFPIGVNGTVYRGQVDGIWAAANGNARITEMDTFTA